MKGNWQGPSKIVAVLLPIVTYKYNLNPCNVHFNFKKSVYKTRVRQWLKLKHQMALEVINYLIIFLNLLFLLLIDL